MSDEFVIVIKQGVPIRSYCLIHSLQLNRRVFNCFLDWLNAMVCVLIFYFVSIEIKNTRTAGIFVSADEVLLFISSLTSMLKSESELSNTADLARPIYTTIHATTLSSNSSGGCAAT